MASRDIMRHRAAGRESGAAGRHSRVAGDAVVQPEDAVRRHAEDGTMVGGGAGDRSGGVRRVAKWKARLGAEDTSGGRGHIWRRKMHQKAGDASEGGSRVRDGKAWHKGVPLTVPLTITPL